MAATITTLLTPNEVTEYTAVKLAFNACTFREIFTIEHDQADRCLGVDFWEDLKAAVADYSAETTWVSGSTYNTGEVVKHRGIYWMAQADGITSQPATNNNDWEEAPKFDPAGACAAKYQEAYSGFLAPYLAWTILEEQLPFIRRNITDRGVLEVDGDKYNTASETEMTSLKHAINRRRYLAWRNWRKWVTDDANKDLACFANYKPFKENEDGCTPPANECEPRFKRTGVYRFG